MQRILLIGGAGVTIAAAAMVLNYLVVDPPGVEPEATAPAGEQPATAEEAAAAPAIPDETAPAEAAPAEAAGAADADVPAFDVVRVEPDGDTVLAGRASPGWDVTIYDGPDVVGTVTADRHGEWVLVPDRRLQPGTRELRLEARSPEGAKAASENVVVMIVPDADESWGAVALELSGEEGGESRLLQAPQMSELVALEARGLSVQLLEYDSGGAFTVSGTARPDARVQLYLNNDSIGTSTADAGGGWTYLSERSLPDGPVLLRVDQLGPHGKVTSRVEVTIDQRIPAEQWLYHREIVVEPGNNLWVVAKRAYGDGVRYALIFGANREQIRDADLIYPGQVFLLPEVN